MLLLSLFFPYFEDDVVVGFDVVVVIMIRIVLLLMLLLMLLMLLLLCVLKGTVISFDDLFYEHTFHDTSLSRPLYFFR